MKTWKLYTIIFAIGLAFGSVLGYSAKKNTISTTEKSLSASSRTETSTGVAKTTASSETAQKTSEASGKSVRETESGNIEETYGADGKLASRKIVYVKGRIDTLWTSRTDTLWRRDTIARFDSIYVYKHDTLTIEKFKEVKEGPPRFGWGVHVGADAKKDLQLDDLYARAEGKIRIAGPIVGKIFYQKPFDAKTERDKVGATIGIEF